MVCVIGRSLNVGEGLRDTVGLIVMTGGPGEGKARRFRRKGLPVISGLPIWLLGRHIPVEAFSPNCISPDVTP